MENISFAYACKHNLTNIVKKYLEYKNDKSHEKWVARMKKSDLMFTAIQRGQIELVKIFINQGFDPRTKNSLALHLACLYGNFEIIKSLVDNIISWSHMDCEYSPTEFICGKNNLAMRIVISFGHYEIANFLYNNAYNCSPDSFCMEQAFIQHNREKLQFIIDHGNSKINEPYIIHANKDYYHKLKFHLTASNFFQHITKDDFLFYTCCDKEFKIIEFIILNNML